MDQIRIAAQCTGKVAFSAQRIAKEAAHRRKGRVAYRCKFCFHWHVGTPPQQEKKFTKRRKRVELVFEPEWSF